tara:strand:+ start:1036 stop:2709 length:1674 start_codon:yes stop_codon:yes gene_type:complete
MNILEVEDVVKGMPDEALQKEAQKPTGRVPQFLVVSEIQRRTDMRERFKAQQSKQPKRSVKEQIVSQGIAAISPEASRQMPFMRQPMQQPMAQPMPPQQMPVNQMGPEVPMFRGGVVRYDNGGGTLRRDVLKKQGFTDQEIDLMLANQMSEQAQSKGIGGIGIPSADQLPLEEAYEEFPGQLENIAKALEGNAGGFREMRTSEAFPDDYDVPDAAYGSDQDGFGQDLAITETIVKEIDTVPNAIVTDESKKTDQQRQDDLSVNVGGASVPTVVPNGEGAEGVGGEDGALDPKPKTGYEILQDRMQAFMDATKETPSTIDLSKPEAMLKGLQVDFSSLAPDYTYEKALAEKRAEEELSDSRKDAWNQALIQLGAGIIEGKTGEGLSKAGQTAYDMIKEGKASARSERDLATKLKMAEEQGAMQTGLQGKMAEIERDKAIATMQADAEKTMYSGQLKERELALESLVKQAAVLRYGDLVLERDDANMREILDIAGSYVKAAAEQYVLEGKSVDDLLKEIVIPIIDQLSPQFRGEVEGEEKVTDKKKFRYNPKTQQMEPA